MTGKVSVDYMGDGTFYDAIHPKLQVANIMGEINLPIFSFAGNTQEQVEWTWEFNIPTAITSPFFYAVGIKGCDHYFTPVNVSTGRWRIKVVGKVSVCYLYNNTRFPVYQKLYGTPVTTTESKILYGDLRG